VRARPAGMNDALWNSLVIEMGDLLGGTQNLLEATDLGPQISAHSDCPRR
jgi:hypothetical protein